MPGAGMLHEQSGQENLDDDAIILAAGGNPGKKAMLKDLKQADAQQELLLMNFVNGVHERKAAQKGQPEKIRPSESVAFLVCHSAC